MSPQRFPLSTFQSAYEQVNAHVLETPCTYHAPLDLYFKWEHHQHTKSFKPRGALNKILSLSEEQLAAGLMTGSAGNHGQAVALAAGEIGASAHIFVPQATPRVKVDSMRSYGAQVERVPGQFGEAEAQAIQQAKESGATFVSAYNDPAVIAGQGTLALEWLAQAIQQAKESGATFVSAYNDPAVIAGQGTLALEWLAQAPDLERLLIPVGGGGLICGLGLVAKALKPKIEIIGVLSEASPFLYHQYYYGHMEDAVELPTLTDGLAGAVEPGSITIDLLPHAADAIIQVTEDAVAEAIAYTYKELGEVVEGSGAVGLAAVMSGQVDIDRPTGSLVTGGNIDPEKHAAVLAAYS